jgi:hypothetical protein
MVEILNFLQNENISKLLCLSKKCESLVTGCIANFNSRIDITIDEDISQSLWSLKWVSKMIKDSYEKTLNNDQS